MVNEALTPAQIAVDGAAQLFWQARTVGTESSGPARAACEPQAGPRLGEAARALALRWEGLPESADGGTDAARSSAPDTAARAAHARLGATAGAEDPSRGENGQRHDGGANQAVA